MNSAVFSICLIIFSVELAISDDLLFEDGDSWRQKSESEIRRKIASLQNAYNTLKTRPAKNVVLFVGDGLGVTVLTAARIYNSEKVENASYQEPFRFEKFPFGGLSKTHSTDSHVSDSAAGATALLCGVKTLNDLVSLNPDTPLGHVETSESNNIKNCLAELALRAGKAVGLVTTTRVTHATPAAFYAHSANRRWECDVDVENFGGAPGKTKDIARQMIEDYPANEFAVILGGGFSKFKPNCSTDPYSERMDGRNLIHEWQLNSTKRRTFVSTLTQLRGVDYENTDQLLGLFTANHLPYSNQYKNDTPNLTEMSLAALKILSQKENGFFLFIEAGKIDMALHYNQAKRSLEEVLALDKAVNAVLSATNPSETLIVVTADHSHNLNIIGFPSKNVSILGLVQPNDRRIVITDNMPSTILTFADGPSAKDYNEIRQSLNDANSSTDDNEFRQLAMIPRPKASHGGEDVPVYATGPYSFLFTGLIENAEIAHYIAAAACLEPNKAMCTEMTGGENVKPFSLKDITLNHYLGTVLTFFLSVCLFVSLFINVLLACRTRQ